MITTVVCLLFFFQMDLPNAEVRGSKVDETAMFNAKWRQESLVFLSQLKSSRDWENDRVKEVSHFIGNLSEQKGLRENLLEKIVKKYGYNLFKDEFYIWEEYVSSANAEDPMSRYVFAKPGVRTIFITIKQGKWTFNNGKAISKNKLNLVFSQFQPNLDCNEGDWSLSYTVSYTHVDKGVIKLKIAPAVCENHYKGLVSQIGLEY